MAFGDARANFATSTVATAPSPATSGTSLVVAAGEGARFPAVSFNAVIAPSGTIPTPTNAEVVRVTARATDTLTITRTQESSSARTVVVGDRIYAGPTAGDHALIETNHAATGSITTIEPDDAAAGGSATTWARGDHTHAIATGTPGAITGTAAEGSATSFARSDHDHGLPNFGTSAIHLGYPAAMSSFATGSTNQYYVLRVLLLSAATLTGVVYYVGNAGAQGNVRSSLWDPTSTTRLANRTTNLTHGTANQYQLVPFDSQYAAAPGRYLVLLWFSSATAQWWGGRHFAATLQGTQASNTPASISAAGLENVDRPLMTTY